MTPEALGLQYRRSGLLWAGRGPGRAPARAAAARGDKAHRRRDAGPAEGGPAHEQANFGSVFKNPDHELSAGRMLEACGLRGFAIGGAQISPRHANFIENADSARTADALALMAEARRRARERFGVELDHEVQLLGVALPECDPLRRRRRGEACPERLRYRRGRAPPWLPSGARAQDRAQAAVAEGRATAITLAVVALAAGVYLVARDLMFAVDTIDVRGAPPSIAGQLRAALAISREAAWSRWTVGPSSRSGRASGRHRYAVRP